MFITTVSSLQEAADALKDGVGPVVALPVYNAYEDVIQCLWALFRHTPSETDILIIDDGSVEAWLARLVESLGEITHRVIGWEHRENRGFVATANETFRAAGRRDVVLLNSDVVVGPEWLERLQKAAHSDTRLATATPLTNNGTILSVPYRNTPSDLPSGCTPESAARAIAASSYGLRPRIPTAIGHCLYIKRMAIDLVGEFDEVFSPGYGEEVDFSQRCHLVGLAHVCADDVFVYHRGSSSFGRSPETQNLKEQHEQIIARRYRYYHPWVHRTANDTTSALATAIAAARRALLGMTVLVDATCLRPVGEIMGTQRNVVETIRALTRHPRINRVIAFLPPSGPAYLIEAFAGCDKLELIRKAQSPDSVTGVDVAYRPFQVSSTQELKQLRKLGDRVVLAQLDFIAFNNPGYFPTPTAWEEYRNLTKLTLAIADGVSFISRHTEAEARVEGLI
ncbi:MAG TPA: glycosyltransferase, partial [Candidatus Binatia bacterium]|nr:glycosyltransferase [Candidatus Binatia bacterium]